MGLKKQFLKSKPVCKVTFSLPKEAALGAKEVKVLGEFNNWEWQNGVPMKAKKDNYTAVVELPAGKAYQFRYLFDNQTWENDWAADYYLPTPFGVENSVVEVTETIANIKTIKKTRTKKASNGKKVADKLSKIEGIGPKIEQLLKNDGIDTFAKLAKAPKKTLIGILESAGSRYKMHDPTTWPQQAKLAAKGAWDDLKVLQDKLNGGRK